MDQGCGMVSHRVAKEWEGFAQWLQCNNHRNLCQVPVPTALSSKGSRALLAAVPHEEEVLDLADPGAYEELSLDDRTPFS